MMPRARQGFSVFLLSVLGVAFLLLTMGLRVGDRGDGITRLIRSSGARDRCSVGARKALIEAVHRLRVRANDPDRSEFEWFRKQEYPLELHLGSGDLVHTERSFDSGYALEDGVRATILRRAFLSLDPKESVPYESVGVLRLEARVLGPFGASALEVRELGFRAVRIAPPRPFDQPTFLMLEANPMIDAGSWQGSANRWIQAIVDYFREEPERMGQMADRFAEASLVARELRDFGKAGSYRRMEREARRMAYPGSWPQVELSTEVEDEGDTDLSRKDPSPGGGEEGEDAPLHLFEPNLVLYSFESEVDLVWAYLPLRHQEWIRQYEEIHARWKPLHPQLERLLADPISNFEAIEASWDRLEEITPEWIQLDQEILDSFREFQARFIEVAGQEGTQIEELFRARLKSQQMAWQSEFRFSQIGPAEEFLRRDPTPAGLISTEGGLLPLQLASRRAGRVFLHHDGPIEVQNFGGEHPDKPLILYARQELLIPHGFQGALLVEKGTEVVHPLKDLKGSLILNARSTPLRFLERLFTGTLTRDESISYGEGIDPRTIHVSLSLQDQYRRVDR